MFLFTTAFLLGDIGLQFFPSLPGPRIIYTTLVISTLFWLATRRRWRYTHLPLAFILGFTFTAWYAHDMLSWSLPKRWEGRPLLATGIIASLPITENKQTHFLFSLQRLQYENEVLPSNALIKLSLSETLTPAVRTGDLRRFIVRLKRIHGTQNPGAFDFEAWALQKGLRASGYIVSSTANQLLAHHWYDYPLQQFRERLQEKIQAQLPHTSTAPWLMALMIGEHTAMTQTDWQVLRNTGTNHLMAIAGLHIGIAAGLMHGLVSWCWRRFPALILCIPVQQAGACAALLAALLYSALSGFALPTQRACFMLAVFILALLARRQLSGWHAWSLALLLVLLVNPLSVLTDSFWLSFGTIALILYGMHGRLAPTGYWWKWGRVQWVIGLGLIPITLALFQQCSLVSFLANSIAIPWLGFCILPFCLLSNILLFISPTLSGLLLWLADKSLAGLWLLLTWFSQLPFSSWHLAMPTTPIFLLTVTGFLLLLLPSGFPCRIAGFLWLIPLVMYQPAKPAPGDFWLTLLDVGQGLSAVVQTKNHLLVYDAGPKYQTSFDMGESVVLPYLYKLHTRQIDMLVISHGDNDHSGGAQAILTAMPVKTVKSSVPEVLLPAQASTCISGETWQWDEVTFSFLYPYPYQLHLGNDSSCVLLIDNGKQRLLLTGDIEKMAEATLLSRSQHSLAANILIAPHHGSKTSGLPAFIEAVHPQFVLYATGYRNRYHFPHARIMSAYAKIQALQLNTAETGAIKFKLDKRVSVLQAERYREKHKRYWYPE